MAPPRSSRTSRSSAGRSSRNPPLVEPAAEDVEVVMPTDEFAPQDPDAVAAPPKEPGRRSSQAGRSNRRQAASSKPSGRTSARQLTPEELDKRRASRNQALTIVLGILIGMIVAVCGWWFLLRVDPRVNTARQTLKTVAGMMLSIENAIVARDPVVANQTRESALKLLGESAELGFAKNDPDPRDPKLSSPELARQAAALKEELLSAWKTKVEQVERDVRVETNKRTILAGFAVLLTAKDEQLAVFEREVSNFLDNPVLPGSGRNEDYIKEYNDDLAPLRVQVGKIAQEKDRRITAITDIPVREARGLAAIAVQQEKFQAGMAQIDELARTYTTADFTGVRTYVRDSAKLAWETAIAAAEENFKTYQAPGTTKDMAEKSLEAARARMQQVIDNFGIDEYVSQAKEALARFQAKT